MLFVLGLGFGVVLGVVFKDKILGVWGWVKGFFVKKS
jgi:hypothetical protein